jgi:hypothetical protein
MYGARFVAVVDEEPGREPQQRMMSEGAEDLIRFGDEDRRRRVGGRLET